MSAKGTAKERPLIMSGRMIRAIIVGRKTQTRQLIRGVSPDHHSPHQIMPAADYPRHDLMFGGKAGSVPPTIVPVAYHVGDRLWIKETWGLCSHHDLTDWCTSSVSGLQPDDVFPQWSIQRRADWGPLQENCRWRSPVAMPRWATRITLEITEVRVQKLQEISDDDAIAEGARHFPDLPSRHRYGQDARWSMEEPKSTADCLGSPRFAFANYVNKLHRKPRQPDIWEVNPFVWSISFRRAI